MPRTRRVRLLALLVCAVTLLVAACRSGPDELESDGPPELTPEQLEIERLENELAQAREEIDARDAASDEMEASVADLRENVAALENEITRLESRFEQITSAQEVEINDLLAEREALLADLERISNAAEIAASQAGTRSTGGTDSRDEGSASQSAEFASAVAGRGGYVETPQFGFQENRRLTSRLAVSGTGLAVDSSGEVPMLYDASVDYNSSAIYLAVRDPAGRSPELLVTLQYVSEERPLYTQTAYIAIEGRDPVDPVDPIIFTGAPVRDTDGERLRELFSRPVDADLLNRLLTMLSSSGFVGTFVGATGRETYRPTVVEREAMSRVIFAYIDLGGL
jgi:TolA-binding protein